MECFGTSRIVQLFLLHGFLLFHDCPENILNLSSRICHRRYFWSLFHSRLYFHHRAPIFISTYTNAHAKIKKWIFSCWFQGNWLKFCIISNDFWSSTIWAIQIQFSFTEFKNSKNPGIQPFYVQNFSAGLMILN